MLSQRTILSSASIQQCFRTIVCNLTLISVVRNSHVNDNGVSRVNEERIHYSLVMFNELHSSCSTLTCHLSAMMLLPSVAIEVPRFRDCASVWQSCWHWWVWAIVKYSCWSCHCFKLLLVSVMPSVMAAVSSQPSDWGWGTDWDKVGHMWQYISIKIFQCHVSINFA
jgi:hypothetical protein